MKSPQFIAIAVITLALCIGSTVPAHACQSNVSANGSFTGSWTPACTSAHRSGRYARYYTFTVSGTVSFQADLTSSTDAYLLLLSGSGSGGSVIAENDDGGGNNNSRITRTLSPGTYTMEATTFSSGATGSFTLTLQAAGSGGSGCQFAVNANSVSSGLWTSGCTSAHRSGRYAKYYTFTVSETVSFQADLTSSTDAYLLLLSGSGSGGSVITENDDGAGNNNSRITRTLSPGTYTMEATTFNSGATGSFTMTLQAAGNGGGNCQFAVGANSISSGSWTSGCTSAHRSGRYAKYYTFTVSSTVSFQADLTSSTDAYLLLLSGSGSGGSVIAENDDGGGNNNSRITRTLSPGTYTMEATTFSSGATGSFTLTLQAAGSGGGSSCTSSLSLNTTTPGSWSSACQSAHRAGSYARYYTFSLSATTALDAALSSTAADAYLYLLQGTGSSGSVLAQNDDGAGNNNSRIQMTLQPGSYTLEATTYSSGQSGSFSISAGAGSSGTKTWVFLVHGLRQSSSAMDSLRQTLSSADFGIDTNRFQIDSGFNWSECANNPNCGTNCLVSDGGRALARYINSRNPTGPIVLIGYSLGGLISRDMILNNYESVLNNRPVAALITLGTPHVGYPFCEIDVTEVCPLLAVEMASQFRVNQATNSVIVSTYLFNMIPRWGSDSFTRAPQHWLAAAGTFCSNDRFCEWNDIDSSVDQGCPDNDAASDGVVCKRSALYQIDGGNLPTETWMDSNYAHIDNFGSWAVMCGNLLGNHHNLFNPPGEGTLVTTIRELINGLR
jgi:pimeloyl-ACP methyl ester carboxylesterase